MTKHPRPEVFENHRVKLGEGLIGWVAETRTAQVVPDALKDPRVKPLPEDPDPPRSMMVIPLIVEDCLTGAIAVGRSQPGAYTEEHLRLLTILGSQAAVAVENAILYRRTEELAITDPLTGLYNYRYFYVKLGDELKKARLNNSVVSLIFIDVDSLKHYNDTYGHQAGDRILQRCAELILENIRESDAAVRYAGDEFVVVLSNTGIEEARKVATRIRRSSETRPISIEGGPEVRVTMSAGIACYPETAGSESELIHQADAAMYIGKHQRRGARGVYVYRTGDEPGW